MSNENLDRAKLVAVLMGIARQEGRTDSAASIEWAQVALDQNLPLEFLGDLVRKIAEGSGDSQVTVKAAWDALGWGEEAVDEVVTI